MSGGTSQDVAQGGEAREKNISLTELRRQKLKQRGCKGGAGISRIGFQRGVSCTDEGLRSQCADSP